MSSNSDDVETLVADAVGAIKREQTGTLSDEGAPVPPSELELEALPPQRDHGIEMIDPRWINLKAKLRKAAKRLVLLTLLIVVLGGTWLFLSYERPPDTYFTFTDDSGVVHIVDGLEKVPAKYRSKAKSAD